MSHWISFTTTADRSRVQVLSTSHGAAFWIACSGFADEDTLSRGFKRAIAVFMGLWRCKRSQDTLNDEGCVEYASAEYHDIDIPL